MCPPLTDPCASLGALSENATTRAAALTALRAILGVIDHELMPELMPQLLEALEPLVKVDTARNRPKPPETTRNSPAPSAATRNRP